MITHMAPATKNIQHTTSLWFTPWETLERRRGGDQKCPETSGVLKSNYIKNSVRSLGKDKMYSLYQKTPLSLSLPSPLMFLFAYRASALLKISSQYFFLSHGETNFLCLINTIQTGKHRI